MASPRLRTYSLFLAIILWGTLLGGIAYSHLVYFPVYLSALPDSAVLVNGAYGLNEGRFWLLIHPLLILALIVSVVLNWRIRQMRRLLLLSMGVYALVIALTSVYFVPELIAFQQSPQSNVSAADWFARGQRWQRLSWIRGAIMCAAIFPLLLALTKVNEEKHPSQQSRLNEVTR